LQLNAPPVSAQEVRRIKRSRPSNEVSGVGPFARL
jgi:hypothetical protein